jgi:hypothetical protein
MATILQDDFSDADGTNISGKALDVGGTWTVLSGTWRTQGGICEQTALAATFDKIVADCGESDVTVEVDATTHATLASIAALVCRSSNNTNNWWVYLSSANNTIKIYQFEAGSLTERASAAFTVAASTTYNIKAVTSGNTITAYIDDVEKCNYGSATFQNTETEFGILTVRDNASFGQVTFDNFLVDGVGSGSVAITTPAQYKTFQRTTNGQLSGTPGGTTGAIAITGTYTGSPTAIEASFNGGAYATIDAAPAAGTYSGTLTGQAEGQGTLTVRFTNDTGVTGTKADIGIGDVFVVAGQSNAEGHGTNNQSYSHASLKATKFSEADAWANCTDPTDLDAGGSFWPLLATYLLADLGVPVAFITAAENDTGLHDGDWIDGGTAYVNMQAQVTASGVNGVRAVLWNQGERDVLDEVTRVQHYADLVELAADITADIAGAPKMIVMPIGDDTVIDAADMDEIRLAQQDSWADANIFEGPLLHDFNLVGGANDGVHYKTDADLLEGSKRWWACIDKALYGGTATAPVIVGAVASLARDQVTVEFDQTLDTGLTFTTTAWVVKDGGTPMTVSTVAYHASPTKLVVTTSAAASGALTLSLGLGRTAAGGVIPRSADINLPTSGTTNLRARLVQDMAVTETVGTAGSMLLLGVG